jgi:hypothetical protein
MCSSVEIIINLAEALTLVTCILEVSGSNLSWDTGCPDYCFILHMLHSCLIRQLLLFQHPLCFIIHCDPIVRYYNLSYCQHR